jgi:hypothetical protein
VDVSQLRIRAAPDGSELCLQCGLCCDGIMFSDISVRPHEREYVESLGLPVDAGLDGSGITVFQPCPAFIEGCCSLYEVGRPATCHTYACGLLQGFEAGRATIDDALAVIHRVWALAHELEVEMGMPLGTYNRRALHEYLREQRPWETPSEFARFLVAYYEFNLLGNEYFRYNPADAETQTADVGAEVAANGSAHVR